MACIAVRHHKSGQCKNIVFKDERCKLHYNAAIAKGPKELILTEMYMTYENTFHNLKARKFAGDDVDEDIAVLKVRYNHNYFRTMEMIEMIPDTLADQMYRIKNAERARKRARKNEQYYERLRQEQLDREADWRPMDPWGDNPPAPVEFHDDNQNIHLAVTVNEVVKKTIQKVIKIHVPAEHCWNMETISKTPGEIIVECNLSISAGKLLVEKYTSDETIYDMVSGIYGKTLDSVWQYIKNSSDKEVLIKTLKTELEDNIGMCAQGNLTRLCNVLQGYLDDMPAPPIAEILGDLLPPLMNILDITVRCEKALQIMRTFNVPDDQQNIWLEPLMG
jgi:hypothetical protein